MKIWLVWNFHHKYTGNVKNQLIEKVFASGKCRFTFQIINKTISLDMNWIIIYYLLLFIFIYLKVEIIWFMLLICHQNCFALKSGFRCNEIKKRNGRNKMSFDDRMFWLSRLSYYNAYHILLIRMFTHWINTWNLNNSILFTCLVVSTEKSVSTQHIYTCIACISTVQIKFYFFSTLKVVFTQWFNTLISCE